MIESKPIILIFSAFYDPWMSGAERCVQEIVERLRDDYYFVIVTSRLSTKVPVIEKREGYEIRRVGLGLPLDKWFYIVWAPLAALGLQTRLAHAVMESYAGIVLWLFRWLRPQVKRVLTLQSGDLDDETKQRRIPFWLWKRIHLTPHAVTAISRFLAERATRLGVPAERLQVIPNGVDIENIIPRQPEERVSHRLVTVARLSWEKGLADGLQALKILRELPEYKDAHWIIVGDGLLRGELEQQAESLGLGEAVQFRGRLPNAEALELVKTAETFVCPSLAEGQGIVFVEAQALNVPVIGTRVGGIPEVVENEVTGLLVPPNRPAELAKAVARLWSDRILAERLANEARVRVSRFSWRALIQRYQELYRSLLA